MSWPEDTEIPILPLPPPLLPHHHHARSMIKRPNNMAGIRILHVIMRPATGVARMIETLCAEQIRQGMAPIIWIALKRGEVFPTWAQQFEHVCVRTPQIFGTGALAWLAANESMGRGAFGQSLSKYRPSVIHFHDPSLAGALLPSRGLDDCQILVTFHGLANSIGLRHQPVRRMIHQRWVRRADRLAHSLVTVDPATPALAQDFFGIDKRRFLLVSNGVPGLPVWKPRRGLVGSDLTVGHVGTVDRNKGWRLVAEAVEWVRQQGCPVRLAIAGRGPESQQAAEWAATHREFATYTEWVDDVSSLMLNHLDIFALASEQEGMPMAILEALASGLPIIATRVGGIPFVVRDGVEGLLVDRNSRAVAEAILRLYREPELRPRLAAQARQRWEAAFSVERMAQEYSQVYSLCGRTNSGDV